LDYIKRKFTTKDLGGNDSLNLYPICCWHIGAAQCDLKFIHDTVAEINDDSSARWIYMGDGGECVTRLSKGNVFDQTLSPQEQHDFLYDTFFPIRKKGLWGIRGNHGNRIDLESGLSFDKSLMTALAIPYLGVSGIGNIRINRSSYDVFTHHGAPSGAALQSKVAAAKKAYHVIADIRITGHSHVAMELDPEFYSYADNTAMRILKRPIHQVIAGCAYDSSVMGYAEEKLYSPILPGRAIINLAGQINVGSGWPAHHIRTRIERSMGLVDPRVYSGAELEKWRREALLDPK